MERKKICKTGLFAGLILGLLCTIFGCLFPADEASMPALKTKAKTVAVFKNGWGFSSGRGKFR